MADCYLERGTFGFRAVLPLWFLHFPSLESTLMGKKVLQTSGHISLLTLLPGVLQGRHQPKRKPHCGGSHGSCFFKRKPHCRGSHDCCFFTKKKNYQKMFIPTRNKNIDGAVLERPGRTSRGWGYYCVRSSRGWPAVWVASETCGSVCAPVTVYVCPSSTSSLLKVSFEMVL